MGKPKVQVPKLYTSYCTETDISTLTQGLTFNGYTVRKGFRTDHTTTQWYIRWLIPRYGRSNVAAVIHDHCYDTQSMPRKEADRLFRENLQLCGIPKWKANLYYYGVRVFGEIWMQLNRKKGRYQGNS